MPLETESLIGLELAELARLAGNQQGLPTSELSVLW